MPLGEVPPVTQQKDAVKAAPPQTPKPGETAPPPVAELKPPQNWKAAAREEWARLPRHVQEEAKRVEVEAIRVMRESAQARKFSESFEKTLTPYRAFINGEPLQVVNNLLQTAVALQTAPAADKAQLVAQIIKGYNVDIETLDKLLAGQAPQEAQVQAQVQARQSQQPAQLRDPRVDEWLAREAQEKSRAAQQTVQAFAREAEFLDEPWPGKVRQDGSPVLVRDLVANLLDAASRDGIDLSLKEAYAQVVQQHPDVSKVLRQREEHQRAATARRRAATPGPPLPACGASRRHVPKGRTSRTGFNPRSAFSTAWEVGPLCGKGRERVDVPPTPQRLALLAPMASPTSLPYSRLPSRTTLAPSPTTSPTTTRFSTSWKPARDVCAPSTVASASTTGVVRWQH